LNPQIQNSRISTGCSSIDRLLGDGLPKSQITLVYGESNTGKTTLAMQCAVKSAKNGLKTIYIDSDNTFSVMRLSQIAHSDNLVSSLIYILKPRSFHEQSLLVESLDKYLAKDVNLVVVDTINSIYRLEIMRSETIFTLNRALNRQIAYLGEAAKTHQIAILLISQVHDIVNVNNQPKTIEPVATRVLQFWSNNILKLLQAG
jgi:DNA repair protein RadB